MVINDQRFVLAVCKLDRQRVTPGSWFPGGLAWRRISFAKPAAGNVATRITRATGHPVRVAVRGWRLEVVRGWLEVALRSVAGWHTLARIVACSAALPWSAHARIRADQRRVSEAEVREVLADGRLIQVRSIDGGRARFRLGDVDVVIGIAGGVGLVTVCRAGCA